MSDWGQKTIKQSSYLKGRIGWQGLRASEFIEEGPYLITGTDFKSGKIEWDTCYHVSEDRYREAPYIHIHNSDLLITKDGTIGKVAYVNDCPEQAVLNSGIFLLRCRDSSYLHEFAYHVLNSHIFDDFLHKNLNGSTINHLYQNVFEKFPLPLPNHDVQKRIASILDCIDQAIEKTEALIHKYQQIKAGLMHDLFTRGLTADGKLRPPREQAPELYQETPIGWIPKEWEVQKLKDILLESGGYLQTGPFGSQLHAHEYTHEGIPVVMPQDINDGKISTSEIAKIPEKRALLLQRHRVKIGDIIIARRGELSRAAAISGLEKDWVCGTGCFLLRLGGSKLDARFFSYAYRHDIVQRQVAGLAVGTTMPSLNNAVMNSLCFPYLKIEEQNEIANRLEAMEQQINSLFDEKNKLSKQKSGLMQDLLTGKVPVTIGQAEPAHV